MSTAVSSLLPDSSVLASAAGCTAASGTRSSSSYPLDPMSSVPTASSIDYGSILPTAQAPPPPPVGIAQSAAAYYHYGGGVMNNNNYASSCGSGGAMGYGGGYGASASSLSPTSAGNLDNLYLNHGGATSSSSVLDRDLSTSYSSSSSGIPATPTTSSSAMVPPSSSPQSSGGCAQLRTVDLSAYQQPLAPYSSSGLGSPGKMDPADHHHHAWNSTGASASWPTLGLPADGQYPSVVPGITPTEGDLG